MSPRAEVIPGEFLEGNAREAVRKRLADFVAAELRRALAPLFAVETQAAWTAPARAVLFHLAENLGVVPTVSIEEALADIPPADRKSLNKLGLRFGALHVYHPALLKPKAQALRALLWTLAHNASLPALPAGTAGPRDPALSDSFYRALGFVPLGERFLRVDRVETVLAATRRLDRQGPFSAMPEIAKLAGAPLEELPSIFTGLGYRAVGDGQGGTVFHARPPRLAKRRPTPRHRRAEPDNPFAKLRELRFKR